MAKNKIDYDMAGLRFFLHKKQSEMAKDVHASQGMISYCETNRFVTMDFYTKLVKGYGAEAVDMFRTDGGPKALGEYTLEELCEGIRNKGYDVSVMVK